MLVRRRSSAYLNGVFRRATLPPPLAAWAAIPLSILLVTLAYPALLRPPISALRADAERGDADAMFRLSERLHRRGDCSAAATDWDGPQSLRWLQAAADRGHPAAMLRLAEAFEDGAGVAVDLPQSLAWYRKACDAGDADAAFELGDWFETGFGGRVDLAAAAAFYRTAADRGHQEGRGRWAETLARAANAGGVDSDATVPALRSPSEREDRRFRAARAAAVRER